MDEFVKARPFVERTARGRPFAKGNPGRKPGSKNKTTLIGEALLKEAEEQLLRKAIEMAKAGDGPIVNLAEVYDASMTSRKVRAQARIRGSLLFGSPASTMAATAVA
jgi:hypothetical protein